MYAAAIWGLSHRLEAFVLLLENEAKTFAYQHYENCYNAGNIYVSSTKTMLPVSLVVVTFKSQSLGQRNEHKNCSKLSDSA